MLEIGRTFGELPPLPTSATDAVLRWQQTCTTTAIMGTAASGYAID